MVSKAARATLFGIGFVCLASLFAGCSEPGSDTEEAAAEGNAESGESNPSSAGRFENDAAAQGQYQQINQQIARTRDVTRPQVEALESLYARYPDAAPVRSLLHQAYVMRFDNESAIQLIENVPARQRTDTETKLLAQRFITVGRHQDAVGLLEPLRASQPQDTQVLKQLGQAYNGLGDFETTAQMLDAVWEEAGAENDPGMLYLRGQAYFQLDHADEAIEVLERCLSINPRHASAHYTLARAYSKAGDRAKAASHQQTFQELSDQSEEAMARKMRLAALARSSNQAFDEGRYEDCETFLKQGLELAEPGLKIQLHQYLARVYEAMERLDEARVHHEEAQRLQQRFNR